MAPSARISTLLPPVLSLDLLDFHDHGLFWRALRDECVSPRTYRNSASQADQTPVRRTLRAMAM
jgi:hypothetical protein